MDNGVRGEITGIIQFLEEAERLKNAMRSGYSSKGRQESVAEHTWRLCLMCMLLQRYSPGANLEKLMKMCIIHDLGEALHGDIPAPEQVTAKGADERADLVEITASLPPAISGEILQLWDEYEAGNSAEARLAKALDKLETILQHTQGRNPPDFDYGFNLEYGRKYTENDPVARFIRELLDEKTRARAGKQ